MMKKLKFIPRLVLLLFFFNCTQEEGAVEITETPVALGPEIVKIKEQVDALYGTNPFPTYPSLENGGGKNGKSEDDEIDLDLHIEWDNYTTFTDGELEVYEFRASEPASSEVVSELVETFTYTLLSVARDGETAYYLMKLSHMEGSDLQATFSDPAGFTGTAQVYDMENRIKAIHYFEQGEMKSKISGPELEGSKTGRGNCHANRAGTNGGPFDFNTPTCNNGGGGRYVDVIIYHYTDNYNYRGNGEWEYSNSKFNGISTETIWIPDENDDPVLQIDRFLPREYTGQRGGQYDPADFYNWFQDQKNELDDRVLDNLTNPCASTIFSELKRGIYRDDVIKPEIQVPNEMFQLNFSESILLLFNESSTFDYVITNGSLTESNASTSGAVTTINDAYLNTATELSIARTMIHELVHAYLNLQYGNPMSFDNGLDFRLKMEKFAQDNGISNITSNEFHHEFMGGYINAMAFALSEWDKIYGSGENLSWDYYYSMAFSGQFTVNNNGNIVSETNSFKTIIPNRSERERIVDIVLNEQNGNNNAKGTKCN